MTHAAAHAVRAAGGLPCPPAEIDTFLSEPSPEVTRVLTQTPGPVFVLGAGGKMGLHLSMMLRRGFEALGRRDEVVAVSRFRTLNDRETFERNQVATIACDLADAEALQSLPDASTVFFLAGAKFGTADNPELLQRANVTLPKKVAERFRNSRIVAFSSGCVYPFVRRDSDGATEATPLAPVGEYAESCVARERAFIEASARHGTRVALVRLNYSVEFRYGVLIDVAVKVIRGEPVDVTTGYANAIWQRDAVAQIIQSIDIAASPAVPINIAGPEIWSVREIAQRFATHFGRTVQFVGREADTALLNNASKSHRLFGTPAASVDDMVNWIAAWLKQGGETWGKPTAFETRDGRF